MTYLEKLMDPRWQRKRLMVFDRAGWACENCESMEKTLHVHHLIYSKGEPWDAPDKTLECLCVDCHDWRTGFDNRCGERYCVSTKKIKKLIADAISKEMADKLYGVQGRSEA